MSNRLKLIGIFAICFVLKSFTGHAAVMPAIDTGDSPASVFDLNPESLVHKSNSELQAEIGRKLTFKEKIALKFVKRKLKKNKDLSPKDALEQAQIDGLAIAGFVTGLVGIFIFGIILGILGIVFSAIALSRIRKEPEVRTGRGLAIAGLVLGIISVVGAFIIIAAA